MQSLRMLSKTAAAAGSSRRWLQTSAARLAVSNFQMPAMSPTMTEGNIASWKKKDGEAFAAGDVLLEIETDKATIDVEAQDDGIMGKILAPDGTKNIPVGKTIALLAEEGDDISNLEPPKEDTPAPPKQEASSSAPTPPKSVPDKQDAQPSSPSPNHSTVHPKSPHPLFPSVLRLLQENGIENTDKIKGTGVRGMLTKGDVLTYLGRASGPMGTYKETPSDVVTKSGGDQTRPQKKEEPQLLDGAAVRQLIVRNMLEASIKARQPPAPPADFDSIIADYLPHAKAAGTSPAASSLPKPPKPAAGYLDGLI